MTEELFFPFADYWWFYVGFILSVLALLLIDLGIFHKRSHAVGFREATLWTVTWISLALIFNLLLYFYSVEKFSAEVGSQLALEFLTGFLVEKSLAVDNVFIFAVIFGYFNVPASYQHKVLFYGILGALIFRGIFIVLGAYLMSYHAVVIFFGVFLVLTGMKMLFTPEKPIEPEKNPVIKFLVRHIPVTAHLEGDKLFLRKNGVLMITPLFVTLVVIELTDIVFAIDSVPAIFAITKEPLIVFTSNIFAILGLRAIYFMISGVLTKFYLLRYGLALVLVFVGLKMTWLNEVYDGKFPITYSLGIIALLIGGAIGLSLIFPKRSEINSPPP